MTDPIDMPVVAFGSSKWAWDRRSETWLYGEESHGCGVYEDLDKVGMRFFGNVSAYGQIVCLRGERKLEVAMQKCLEQLSAMEKEYDPTADLS